MILKDLNFY